MHPQSRAQLGELSACERLALSLVFVTYGSLHLSPALWDGDVGLTSVRKHFVSPVFLKQKVFLP